MKGLVAPGDHERGPPTILALVKFDYVPGRLRAGAGSLGRWGIRQAEVNYQTLSVDGDCEGTYQF